jgi:hypothetical protein
LICAVITTGYAVLLFAFTPKYYFNFLTNWGNTITPITFIMLSIAHWKQGHYKCGRQWEIKGKSCYWKFVVLVYECNTLVVWMITIGYWFAVFPTDLVLPDYVVKPNLDPKMSADLQETPLEKACIIYFFDRHMTTKNYIFPPTPEFIKSCNDCCSKWVINKKGVVYFVMGLMHSLPFIGVTIDMCFSSFNFYWRHLVLFMILSIGYLGVNLM